MLTKGAHLKIVAKQGKYIIRETPIGGLFFKLLMQKAIIGMRATATHLRKNLTNLDTYMTTVNSNIEKFNQYVKVNVEGLRARGERTDDLMINLFKAYQVASDAVFVQYIKIKRNL